MLTAVLILTHCDAELVLEYECALAKAYFEAIWASQEGPQRSQQVLMENLDPNSPVSV